MDDVEGILLVEFDPEVDSGDTGSLIDKAFYVHLSGSALSFEVHSIGRVVQIGLSHTLSQVK